MKQSIKIGNSPSFNPEWVRTFESKEAFKEYIKGESYAKYASDIWDKCHLADELKVKKVSEEISEKSVVVEAPEPEVEKVSTKKKAVSKKE